MLILKHLIDFLEKPLIAFFELYHNYRLSLEHSSLFRKDFYIELKLRIMRVRNTKIEMLYLLVHSPDGHDIQGYAKPKPEADASSRSPILWQWPECEGHLSCFPQAIWRELNQKCSNWNWVDAHMGCGIFTHYTATQTSESALVLPFLFKILFGICLFGHQY